MKKFLLSLLPALLLLPLPLIPAQAQDKPPDKPAAAKHGRGYKPLTPEQSKAIHAAQFKKHGYLMRTLAKNATPPAEFDLKDMGIAGDGGDQADCGSCYLYSTVKTMTSAAVKAGIGKVDVFRLSPQFGMDCHDFGGCGGGNGTEVIAWAVKNGWYAEADPAEDPGLLYPPYEARSRSCRVPANAKKFFPKSWAFVTGDQGDHPATVDEYKAALMTYGRVNVALDAGGQFSNYSGGVITSLGNSIDHEINVRGWSDAKQALLLENQWKGWGGAKSPGDNCAWLSYKAVGSLQDPFTVFFETVVPPTPPVPPVPPGPTPPVPPVPPGPTPPPTPGTVSINLTPDQVASVNQQSGALVISGGMTLQQLVDAVNSSSGTVIINTGMTLEDLIKALDKAKAIPAKPCAPCNQSKEPPAIDAPSLKRIQDEQAELRRRLDALLDALLKKE